MNHSQNPRITALTQLIETVHRLRAPGGCPWDREQTHQSLRQYLIEEAFEVLDVLDQVHTPADLKNESVKGAFREELGDVLMQVLLHSEMTREQGAFDFYDVAEALNDKLIRRHPHVFGDVKVDGAESAFQMWEKQKAKEKASKPKSGVLDGVPKGLPALQRAGRVLEKVTKVGFQWNDLQGPMDKVDEELAELKAEIKTSQSAESSNEPGTDNEQKKKIEAELGDLLFSLCNVAFLMKVNPEDALRTTLHRFERRFRHIEARLKDSGRSPEDSSLEEMDKYWDEAKKLET